MESKKYDNVEELLSDGDFNEETLEAIEKEGFECIVWFADGTLYGIRGGYYFYIVENLDFPESEV